MHQVNQLNILKIKFTNNLDLEIIYKPYLSFLSYSYERYLPNTSNGASIEHTDQKLLSKHWMVQTTGAINLHPEAINSLLLFYKKIKK